MLYFEEDGDWIKVDGPWRQYEVNQFGDIRNSRTLRVLKGGIGDNGYRVVTLSVDGVVFTEYVHILVCRTFHGRPYGDFEVNHKDGNKLNNAADNLEWVTGEENVRHAYLTGLRKTKQVRIVETGEVFDSASDCARHLEVSRSYISNHLAGRRAHTIKGYHIEYV